MPFMLATAATAALLIQPLCSWNRPGADPYRGTVADAIAHYRDIDAADRRMFVERIAAGTPDDVVAISREAIAGRFRYDGALRDMHFGRNDRPRLCRDVDRSHWSAARSEPAAVYCVNGHCILIPRICGNISRVQRVAPAVGNIVEVVIPPPPIAVPQARASDWLTGAELGLLDSPAQEEEDSERPLAWRLPFPTQPTMPVEATPPLAPVPEPSAWAMLLVGLALCIRRRRRTVIIR